MSTLNDPRRGEHEDRAWWSHAVVYQVYPRSFADADGDGVGDLPGITARLPHLADLGVDAVWFSPFYLSPQRDHGYDVADYLEIDPLFGTMADAEQMLREARDLGLRVIVDLVPNHTSDQHVWFARALAAGPGSAERARYLFREGRGPGGEEPPNNWSSVFGGAAWTRVEEADGSPGEWYLHLFDSTQPDLDWRNPEVGDMFVDVLRFWLDRGVDGFRVDVAHGLFKEESLRDQVVAEGERPDSESMASAGGSTGGASMVERTLRDEPMWDQPEVHDVYRRWHDVLAAYDGDRMTVAEAWTQTTDSMARFVRADEMSQTFNFAWLLAPWSAAAFGEVVTSSLEAVARVGALPTWVLSNHDVVRHTTRYGGGEQGRARARASTLAMLALPGSAYLYQGEELGLEQVDVEPEHRTDPSWFRTGEVGRDGCRVPIPWSGESAPYGFGPGEAQPWLPQPDGWGPLAVEAQQRDEHSTLAFYRRALAARREHVLDLPDEVQVRVDGDLLDVRRGSLRVLLNAGDGAVDLPEDVPADAELLAVSTLDGRLEPGRLPADTAVWLRA